MEEPSRSQLTPWWRSFVLKFVTLYSLIFAVVLLAQTNHLQNTHKEDLVDKFGMVLESIAATASPYIPGQVIQSIQGNESALDPAFLELRRHLHLIQMGNNLREDQVYILRPHEDLAHQYRFVAMLQKKTFIGDIYRPPPSIAPIYDWVLANGQARRTPLFTDENGTFISGLAPIFDEKGTAVAILQVDEHLDAYISAQKTYSDDLKVVLFGAMLAMILVGIRMYHYMRGKVLAVLEGTQAIDQQKYHHRVAVMGQDELASLAGAINRVLFNLKERFEMLKFLPQHTARMIAETAESGVELNMGRSVHVAILESDIRGFTALSSQLSPTGLIQMLNLYIRSQAELISIYNGSIDKYMGDAVLAVFEGEDCEGRALKCALALQKEVGRLNQEEAFAIPIHIGIGLASGSVVMGNIGSDQRMEHTVIGPTVNLAARLCSAAMGGEVLVSARIFQNEPGYQQQKEKLESITAKGFSEPVPCYRIQPQ